MILGLTYTINKDNFIVFACLYDENINFNYLHSTIKCEISKKGLSKDERSSFLRDLDIENIKSEMIKNEIIEFLLELPMDISFYYTAIDLNVVNRNSKGEIGDPELKKLFISGASQIVKYLLKKELLPDNSRFIIPYGNIYIVSANEIVINFLGSIKFGGQKNYNEKTGLKYLSFYKKEFNKNKEKITKFVEIIV